MHAAAACLYLVSVLAACGSKNDDDGELGGHCYPNATCNVGLSCSGGVCVVADAAVPDAALDAPMIDAPPDAYVCLDTYEPNGTISTAYVTSVDGTTLSKALQSTLCPGGDKDDFAVSISVADRNLELLVDMPAADSAVFASILNSGGVPIANAVMVTGMPTRLRAYTPNLPTGTYYVEVYPMQGATGPHPYTATVTVTGP